MSQVGETAVILKADVRGRIRRSRAQREQLLDEFERSGLSGPKFAELVGIKYQTFAFWAQRRRKERAAQAMVAAPGSPAEKVRWLEAVIEQAPLAGPLRAAVIVLQLPGGARLEIADQSQAMLAAAFMRALEHATAPC